MKYDDASWHYGGDFPADLAQSAGATHISMFVCWALLAGLGGEVHELETISQLKARSVTPGQFFLSNCDEKFTDEDLNEVGNRFAAAYYMHTNSGYLADYERTFMRKGLFRRGLPSLYHVEDSWANYEKIAPVVEQQFVRWQSAES